MSESELDALVGISRIDFELAMRAHIDIGSQPGEFDAMGDFWFDRLDDGRYELARMEDAWLGYQLATRPAADAITTLRAELKKEREDAERYRNWRDACLVDDWHGPFAKEFDKLREPLTAEKWDAAVDSARRAS